MKRFLARLGAALLTAGTLSAIEPVTLASTSGIQSAGVDFLGFAVRPPLLFRPWYNSFVRAADGEIQKTSGVDLHLEELDDVVERGKYLYTVGFFSPETSFSTYGLKLSLVESYYSGTDGGITCSLLSSDFRRVAGVQSALCGNADELYGVQVLPFFASSNIAAYGVQSSVIGTWADSGAGFQFAGWGAATRNFSGFQFAGAGVFSIDKGRGMQFGGIIGKADDFDGLQLSGFGNLALGTVNGLQLAGIVNGSTRVNGTQIALIENDARILSGVQIALFNTADRSEGGIQIGLLNNLEDAPLKWMPLVNFKW